MKSGRKLSICAPKKAINGASRSRDDLPELNFVTFCDPLLPPGQAAEQNHIWEPIEHTAQA